MKKFDTKDLALNALFGATYIALVAIFNFLSFEAIQFRIAEALLVLLIFNKKLAPGLLLGTAVANLIFSPFGVVDALVGTLASAIAIGLIVLFSRLKIITFIFPALANGIVIGLMISLMNKIPFFIQFGFVFLGEFIVMYTVGLVLYLTINKNDNIKELIVNEQIDHIKE